MSDGRIPTTLAKFFGYVANTNTYLQAPVVPSNSDRLTLSSDTVKKWNTFAGTSSDLQTSKADPLQKGPALNDKVKKLIKDFKTFAQPQLNIIASCTAATTDDALVFNVVLVRKTPSHSHAPITGKCYIVYELLGGGKIKFKCRSISDARRASLIEGADAVEIVYITGDANAKVPTADEMGNGTSFSKATFILSLGTLTTGKVLYIYFRWINTKHPETASPWSELQIIQFV